MSLFPVQVFADEERIQQVLTNLIVNSLKYGVKNGKTEVSLEELNEEKILVKISDNGEGIAEEHLPRLFLSENSHLIPSHQDLYFANPRSS